MHWCLELAPAGCSFDLAVLGLLSHSSIRTFQLTFCEAGSNISLLNHFHSLHLSLSSQVPSRHNPAFLPRIIHYLTCPSRSISPHVARASLTYCWLLPRTAALSTELHSTSIALRFRQHPDTWPYLDPFLPIRSAFRKLSQTPFTQQYQQALVESY